MKPRLGYLVLAAALLTLWLTRPLWAPALTSTIPYFSEQIDFLQGLESFINILTLPLVLLLAYLAWAHPRQPAKELASPLIPRTAAELLDAFIPKDFQVDWVDRQSPPLDQLRKNKDLLLLGPRKIGKTRAAIHLISLAEPALLPAGRLFELNPQPFKVSSGNEIQSALLQEIKPGSPLLIFIDDLFANYPGEALDRLSACLKALKSHLDLYIVATARLEQYQVDHPTWAQANKFEPVIMQGLPSSQIASLVQIASQKYSLPIAEPDQQIFVSNSDGTPELTLLCLYSLKLALAEKKITAIDSALVREYAFSSLKDALDYTRRELVRDCPPAAYLLASLDRFFAAQITPFTALAVAHAVYLWRHNAFFAALFRPKKALTRALGFLHAYGVEPEQAQLRIKKDALFEGYCPPATARAELGRFLLRYRWLSLPPLRRFFPSSGLLARSSNELGNSCYLAKEYSAAYAWLDLSVRLNPTFAPAWSNRGVALHDLGQHRQAVESCNRALAIDPNDATAWINRGVALHDLGQHQQALESDDRALAIDPNYAQAWFNRGVVLGALGQHQQAFESYDRALAIDPNLAQAWNNRGVALGNLGQHQRAVESYDRALAIDPNLAQPWNNRGVALTALGQHQPAVESYDRALTIAPHYAAAWSNRGNAFADLGQHQQAVKSYDRALAIDANLAPAWNNRGKALSDLGQHQQALESCDRSLAIDRYLAQAWYNRGIALSALGQYQQALDCFDRALAINPKDASAHHNLACLFALQNNPQAACTHLEQAIALDPQYSQKACTDPDFDPIRSSPEFQALISCA